MPLINTLETRITEDPAGKKMIVTRDFNAPLEKVWMAWTDSRILDSWWAPRPWKAETKSMDFREGGRWLYCMVGTQGERHWCKLEYRTIQPHRSFSVLNTFCDDSGRTTAGAPAMEWLLEFQPSGAGTTVRVDISFASEADMKTLIDMGFKGGFTMALGNLDEMLG